MAVINSRKSPSCTPIEPLLTIKKALTAAKSSVFNYFAECGPFLWLFEFVHAFKFIKHVPPWPNESNKSQIHLPKCLSRVMPLSFEYLMSAY